MKVTHPDSNTIYLQKKWCNIHEHFDIEQISEYIHIKRITRMNVRIYLYKKLQELRMLSSVTIDCQVTKIVINPGSQLSLL